MTSHAIQESTFESACRGLASTARRLSEQIAQAPESAIRALLGTPQEEPHEPPRHP
jgi:hypothetical protein